MKGRSLLGPLDPRSWPTGLRAFLLGFVLVVIVVAIIGAFATPWPGGIPDDLRAQVESSAAVRGLYLAQQEAKEHAVEPGSREAAKRIDDLIASNNFESGYQSTYRYAWNDAIERLSRRVPGQRLHQEEHTQWIELLQ